MWRKLFQRGEAFYIFYLLFLTVGAGLLLLYGKGQLHLMVNRWHTPLADNFFYWVTRLGEPLFLVLIGLILLGRGRWRMALAFFLNLAVVGSVVGLMKWVIVNDMRPFKFFQYFNIPLHFVDGVRLHEWNTFPSGHTALAFSSFLLLALFRGRHFWSLVFLLLALLVGYSRMYLSMHFLVDVWWGSVLGVAIATIIYGWATEERLARAREWGGDYARVRARITLHYLYYKFVRIPWPTLLTIAALTTMLLLPGLGAVHLFDWDEINFAEAAREMIVTGNYSNVQINYQPFWEKPPLFLWLQALSMSIFGVNEWAARFPNALCGILTLPFLYYAGYRWGQDRRLGYWWAALYAASLLPHFYFKSGIIDPWFNLFIFLGIYTLVRRHQRPSRGVVYLALSGLFIGLAIMTKGPVALLIFGLVYLVYALRRRLREWLTWSEMLAFIAAMLAVGGSWFLLEIAQGRGQVVQDFIIYQIRLLRTQDAGHGGPFFYHWIVLLLGCFPASLFMLAGYRSAGVRETPVEWMKILFWVVLILFSLVRTKIVHYSSLCYFPLTFLGAWYLWQWQADRLRLARWLPWALGTVGSILGALFIALPLIDYFKPNISQRLQDPFAQAALQLPVPWDGWEWLLGLLFWLAMLVSVVALARSRWGLPSLIITCILGLQTMSWVYIPKVEQYSQGAAIEFYKYYSAKDVYLLPLGFKSYAHLYYGQLQLPENARYTDRSWLLSGTADKPVYAVTKVHHLEEQLVQYPQLRVLYHKGGFVFLQVMPL